MKTALNEPPASANGEFSILDAIVALAENFWLVTIIAIAAGLLTAAATTAFPVTYTSVAYLALTDEQSQHAEAIMRSPAVLDAVLAKFPVQGSTQEEMRRSLSDKFRIAIAPAEKKSAAFGDQPRTPTLYSLEVDNSDPRRAQNINKLIIETWLEFTKPRAVEREALELQLARSEEQLRSVSSLVARLEKETPSLLMPGTLGGEIASPIAALLQLRDKHAERQFSIKQKLGGAGIDSVLMAPTLPTERSGPKRIKIAASSALIIGALLAVLSVLRHAARNAEPPTAAKLARIRSSLGRGWKSKSFDGQK